MSEAGKCNLQLCGQLKVGALFKDSVTTRESSADSSMRKSVPTSDYESNMILMPKPDMRNEKWENKITGQITHGRRVKNKCKKS